MLVTELGIVTLVKFVQLVKALSPMLVTLLGKIIEVRLLSAKAQLIVFNSPLSLTTPFPLLYILETTVSGSNPSSYISIILPSLDVYHISSFGCGVMLTGFSNTPLSPRILDNVLYSKVGSIAAASSAVSNILKCFIFLFFLPIHI